jgi:cytochrome c peroxidase
MSNTTQSEPLRPHFRATFRTPLLTLLGLIAAVATLRAQTSSAPVLPATAASYTTPLPAHFLTTAITQQDNTPADNPITDAGATLGRVLFYDKRLSLNQTISCASCHQQANGFSDSRRLSLGFAGGQTDRNSMGLANARWYQRRAFFWDERAANLEAQILQPIQNAVELGLTLPTLVARLGAEPFYAPLFSAAFGSAEVTADRISRAVAQFIRAIASTRTKYDEGVAANFTNFTAEENLGRRLFTGATGNATCAQCHSTDNFVPGPRIDNNGLENPYLDKGLGALTGRAQDEGIFKVPSLRNIALTAPYMHDGRFPTLEAVVEFYNSGIVNHPNLSPPLRTRPPGQGPLRLNLTAAEKAALVAFLKTLSDTRLVTDPRFSDPFPLPAFHTADLDRDGRISLPELTRMIELYNTRFGPTRTGNYDVAPSTSSDGFIPDSARTATASVQLSRYHSADIDRNGKITLNELSRVLEYYNYRTATVRTGAYHAQAGTEDSFTPGP